MKIEVKNMVCNRCIAAVAALFSEMKIKVQHVSLGEVEIADSLSEKELRQVNVRLQQAGFALLEDAAGKQIERMKSLIIQKISSLDLSDDFVLSEYLSAALRRDYRSLSKLFSHNEGLTVERFFILQKIEKVKELLAYRELNLTEISQVLGYKSVQHLSGQFKKITGFSPSQFSKSANGGRIALDLV